MEILKPFLFANTAWMDSASRKAAQADLHAAQFKPLNYISDRTILSQHVRTEQAERKVRVRVFTS